MANDKRLIDALIAINSISNDKGLAFCKMAGKAHGGKISVKSKGKKGSRFSLTLPLERKREN